MNWIYLITAGLFEVVWATTMKLSHGFTKLNYTIMTVVGLALSMGLLALAVKKNAHEFGLSHLDWSWRGWLYYRWGRSFR